MERTTSQKRVLLLTSMGAGLEYYDFVIYALLAKFISQNFFPSTDHYAAIMSTLIVFGIGYMARPIGGIIFGILGDRYGRKKIFIITIFLMAISTFLMGVIPSYAHFGFVSSLIFTFLRICQGLSYGAELPGALTFLTEHAVAKRRGTKCGIMLSSMGIGVTIASFISYLITHFLSLEQVSSWGFRIPFVLGGLLALVGYFMRRHTLETPLFVKTDKVNMEVFYKTIKDYYQILLSGFGSILFLACFVIFGLFLPTYLHDYFNYDLSSVYLANIGGNILSVILLPFLGWSSDHIGRKKLLTIILLLVIFFILPLFKFLYHENIIVLYGFIFIYYALVAGLASCSITMLAESFPVSIRFTSVAICYNLAYTCAAFIPAICTYICKHGTNPLNISFIFMILAIVAIFSVFAAKDNTQKELT